MIWEADLYHYLYYDGGEVLFEKLVLNFTKLKGHDGFTCSGQASWPQQIIILIIYFWEVLFN